MVKPEKDKMKVCIIPDCPFGGKPQPLSNFYKVSKSAGYRPDCPKFRNDCKVCAVIKSASNRAKHRKLRPQRKTVKVGGYKGHPTPANVEMMKAKIRQERLDQMREAG